MVADLNMNVAVVGCPIVREADGLAKSSRNAYLNAEERQAALVLSRAIFAGKAAAEAGERDAAALKALMSGIIEAEPLARIDYVEVVDGVTMQPTEAIGAMALVAERDAAALKALMSGIIEAEPLARIDYVEVVDGVTMQPTEAIGAMALVAMAVYIGSTRLIDNFIFEEGN